MADNYLERREEALRSAGKVVLRRNTPSLDTLLLKNRSHRAYDTTYEVALTPRDCVLNCSKPARAARPFAASCIWADICRSFIFPLPVRSLRRS